MKNEMKQDNTWWPWEAQLFLLGILFIALGIYPKILPPKEGVSISILLRIFFIIFGMIITLGQIFYHINSKKARKISLFLIGLMVLLLGILYILNISGCEPSKLPESYNGTNEQIQQKDIDFDYMNLGISLNDSSICDKIQTNGIYTDNSRGIPVDNLYRDNCYLQVGTKLKDVHICENIGINFTGGDQIDSVWYSNMKKISCFMDIAVKLNNSKICEGLLIPDKIQACYSDAKYNGVY
jgi:hypothetical protein